MRKLLLFVFAIVAFAACEQAPIEEQLAIRTDAPETIRVGFEDNETRIQLNSAQKTVWTKNDLVSVFYKSDANQKWEYRGETGERTAELHKVSAGSSTTKMGYVVVAYPYNEEYIISPATGNLETMLPAVQHYAVDSYGVGNNLMVSCSEFTQFSLKSICGWLKLQLTGNGEVVKGIKFRGNNGEQVAGLIHVDTKSAEATLYSEEVAPDNNGNANGSLVIDGAMATEVMLYCDEGVTLSSEATAFYIALPPQTFEEGFTTDVICTDGTMMAKSSDKKLSIERNHIQPMAAFEFVATGTTDVPTEPENPVNPNLPSNENNKIYYTTTDGKKMFPYKSDVTTFGAILISNIYKDGVGVMTFDDDVTTIGEDAFYKCYSLTSVNIPDSVTTIGDSAFNRCNNLKKVYCYATIPPSLGGYVVFDANASIRRIYVYEECVELYKSAWSSYKDSIYTNGQNCPNTTTIEYTTNDGNTITPSKLPIISNIYENGVGTLVYSGKQIPNDAFEYCTSLTSVTIPDSVTTIGEYAFYECDSLTSVNIGDSVTTIGEYAFKGCSSLTGVTIPDSVTTIEYYAFADCSSLTSVTIGDSVTTIGNDAFSGCSSLTSVTIPDSVTTIGDYAFRDCSCLTSVTIGDGVTTIGRYAFYGCSSLTSVTIPDSVTTIGDSAFRDCSCLTSVTIPNSVTTIGYAAFISCTSLTSITIPDSVTTIDEGAFYNCGSLTSVYCKATTPPALGGIYVFDNNGSGRKIYVPMGSVEAYKIAGWSRYADAIEGYDF